VSNSEPPSAPQPAQLIYVNRPEIGEVMVDAVRSIWIENNTVRLELCANRLEPPNPNGPPMGIQITACRPILSLAAALSLLNGLKQLESALIASGALKPVAVERPDSVN
jgi:hypothetical protein